MQKTEKYSYYDNKFEILIHHRESSAITGIYYWEMLLWAREEVEPGKYKRGKLIECDEVSDPYYGMSNIILNIAQGFYNNISTS